MLKFGVITNRSKASTIDKKKNKAQQPTQKYIIKMDNDLDKLIIMWLSQPNVYNMLFIY